MFMKKIYLVLVAVFLLFDFSFAQKIEIAKVHSKVYSSPERVPANVQTDNTLLFQYCADDIYNLGIGDGTFRMAMVIPKHIAVNLAGKQITKIHVGFGSTAASATSVFIGEDLNSSDVVYTQAGTLNVAAWNEITLTTPYTISGNTDVIIGYEGTANGFRSGFDGKTITPSEYNGYYSVKSGTTYSAWNSLYKMGYYNLSIKATIEGDAFLSNDISPVAFNSDILNVFPGETFRLITKVSNNTASNVTSFKLKYQIGSNEFEETFSEVSIEPWRSYKATKTFSFSSPIAVTPVAIVTEVNGTTDQNIVNDTLAATNLVEIGNYPTGQRNKNVLLEEYTGIACQYCPDGHRLANQLKDDNLGRVGVINIHQGGYANYIPNYKTAFGDALAAQTGLTGYPVGTVNRHVFTGGVTALARNLWAGYASEILNEASPVNLVAKSVVDLTTRTLTVTVNGRYTANSNASTNLLNVAVLQDSIMGPQVSGETYYPEMVHDGLYQHNHMLRTLLTGQWGDSIKETTTGAEFTKQYVWNIPQAINDIPVNLLKLEVLAFIAEGKQEIITSTQATMSKFGSGISSAKQLVQHSPDLKVKEQVYIQNISVIPVTSLTIKYTVDGVTSNDSIYTVSDLNIGTGKEEGIELPLFDCTGANPANLRITILQINGEDVSSTPYVTTVSKDLSEISGSEIKVDIWQDMYGSETTWKLFGTDGSTVVASGGPYTDLTTKTTKLQTATVAITETGCYRFEIYDSYGDGINSGSGAGKYQLSVNGSVFTTGDGTFELEEIKYVGVNSLVNSVKNVWDGADINVYVENREVYIKGEFDSAKLFDLTGRAVSQIDNNSEYMAAPSAGVYVIKAIKAGSVYTTKVVVK